MGTMLDIDRASDFSLAALTRIWNAAYEDYLVPLNFTEALVERHVRRSQIDLSRSLVALVDDRPVGLSLAAVRAERAWIGGFGIALPFRRRGLAGQLMTAQLELLDREGVAETVLEVIDENPARQLYRRSGFVETRDLLLFEGLPPSGPARAETLSPDDFIAAHRRLNPATPTWRREIATGLDGIGEGAVPLGVRRGGEVVGYALAFEHGGKLVLFDAAAADTDAAVDLLCALGARWPALRLRLVDEPSTTPLAIGALASGLQVDTRQVEMARSA
ncbi:MAG TPA: GNAT family N-acetyltransferase [Caulobacteraceae bacterium]|nr:GNAT family N-acetyltransferase [Caulobacteraceae bacterium]